jgi:hypothetical protein
MDQLSLVEKDLYHPVIVSPKIQPLMFVPLWDVPQDIILPLQTSVPTILLEFTNALLITPLENYVLLVDLVIIWILLASVNLLLLRSVSAQFTQLPPLVSNVTKTLRYLIILEPVAQVVLPAISQIVTNGMLQATSAAIVFQVIF